MSQPPQGNPFGDRPTYQNPYAPGTAPPTHVGHDPALGLVVPINTSIWAIAAGYLGLLGLAICFLAPFAVLCGIIALVELKRKPGLRGHVRAVLGIVLGLLGSLGLALMIVAIAAG